MSGPEGILQRYFSFLAEYDRLVHLLWENTCSVLRAASDLLPMTEVRKLGGSLVEISAVSTIIGAPIAESLIHGLKAACGVAWAPMSCFGVIHVVKACLAASTPDFLREAMGLRNQFVDDAIGVVLPVNRFKQARSRMDLGDACAIEVIPHRRWIDRPLLDSSAPPRRPHWRTRASQSTREKKIEIARMKAAEAQTKYAVYRAHCMYTLDKNARLSLDTVPAAEKGSPIDIHRFILNGGRLAVPWRDWLCILLSLTKLIEVFVLRALGSRQVWVWTMVGWAHAFTAAVILQTTGLGRDDATRRTRNLVAGTLPSALRAGEQGRIVLGIPANIRRHVLWRTVLGTAGVGVNLAGLLGTFTSLDSEPTRALYVWIAFQILWLVLRSVVYYFAPGGGSTAVQQGLMTSQCWRDSPTDDKEQVINLLDELAAHQASTHPRGYFAYLHDCMSFVELRALFNGADWTLTTYWNPAFPLPISSTDTTTNRTPETGSVTGVLRIVSVSGDPMIRTVAWMQGSTLDNSELYDACIAFIAIDDTTETIHPIEKDPTQHTQKAKHGKIIALPCVRVFSCHCMSQDGFDRGNSHPECGKIEWWYFFPCVSDSDSPASVSRDSISEGDIISVVSSSGVSSPDVMQGPVQSVGGGIHPMSTKVVEDPTPLKAGTVISSSTISTTELEAEGKAVTIAVAEKGSEPVSVGISVSESESESQTRTWVIAHGKKATGMLDMELVTEAELDRRLSFGWWKISISSMTAMKKTWGVGGLAVREVVEFLR